MNKANAMMQKNPSQINQSDFRALRSYSSFEHAREN